MSAALHDVQLGVLRADAPLSTGVLEIRDLEKRYPKGLLANDGISLDTRSGEVFALLGPNGAGKTTLVKQVIGLLRPTAGSIMLDGVDLVREPEVARQLVAYLPQGSLPIDPFTLREVVELVGRIRGGDRRSVRQRAIHLIDALELGPWIDTLGTRMSGGIRRLVGFVMAAVQPMALVILDEPTNDVDPLRRRLLWEQIRRLGREGTSVLLVTHNVLEAEQAVDRLAVIDEGRIIAQGTPASLKTTDRGSLRVHVNLVPGNGAPPIPPFVRGCTQAKGRLLLLVDAADASSAVHWAQSLMDGGIAEEYALGAASLEDAYVRLIERDDVLDRSSTQVAAT